MIEGLSRGVQKQKRLLSAGKLWQLTQSQEERFNYSGINEWQSTNYVHENNDGFEQ